MGEEQYLWSAARYIERHPVKARLAKRPESYRWSSAKAHLTGAEDTLLSSPSWLDRSELAVYSEFVRGKNAELDEALRKATRTGRPFGSESFIAKLESRLKQTLRAKKVGRPSKK